MEVGLPSSSSSSAAAVLGGTAVGRYRIASDYLACLTRHVTPPSFAAAAGANDGDNLPYTMALGRPYMERVSHTTLTL